MPWPMRLGPEPRISTAGVVARLDLGLLVVGRVVVRRPRRELGGAGVDGLVDRADPEGVPDAADDVLGHAAHRADLGVGEPVPLGQPQQLGRQLVRLAQRVADLVEQHDLVEEPGVDVGRLVQLLDGRAGPERLLHLAAAGRRAAPAPASIERRRRRRRCARPSRRTAPPWLERAQRLLQRLGEVAPDRHRLADALHRRGQGRGRPAGTSRTRTAAP